MIAALLAAAAALTALSRPNVTRLRLPAIVAARGLGASATASAGRARWRGPAARLVSRAPAQPRRVGAATAGAVMAVLLVTGLRLQVAVAAGLVTAVAFEAAIGFAAGRRARSDDASLAQGLSILEAELVAGAREDAALNAAAAVSGRHGRLLNEAAARTGYGSETADVLARSASLRPLSAAWRVRHTCGAPLAELVGQVGRDVDLRRKRQLAVHGALAGPRSSSALLAALPLVGIGLGMAMGARPWPFLLSSSGGSTVLLAGVSLDVAGWSWTAAMVRRASR